MMRIIISIILITIIITIIMIMIMTIIITIIDIITSRSARRRRPARPLAGRTAMLVIEALA